MKHAFYVFTRTALACLLLLSIPALSLATEWSELELAGQVQSFNGLLGMFGYGALNSVGTTAQSGMAIRGQGATSAAPGYASVPSDYHPFSNIESEGGWDMSRGGNVINGRIYSEHALERMAPNTPEVRAELNTRAVERARAAGLTPGMREYSDFVNKQIDPRGIPPSVVESAIRDTKAVPGATPNTFVHQTQDVMVIVNEQGTVVTVIPQ